MFPAKFLLDKKSLFIEKKENSVFGELIQLFQVRFFSFHLLAKKDFFCSYANFKITHSL